MIKIQVFDNEAALGTATADFIVRLSEACIKQKGTFSIALSGGSTPDKLFVLLAAEPYNKQVDWKNTFVFWGDERYLPETDPQNNSHQAKQLLLNNVDIPAENIFVVPVKMTPSKAANHYEQTLRSIFKEEFPSFDLILLGMGDNGHTASLFPHTTILDEKKALVKEVFVKEVEMYRVSFTAKLINHAKNIMFLVTGTKKASMLHKVLEGPKKFSDYPAQMITPDEGNNLYWFIDKEAAANLKKDQV